MEISVGELSGILNAIVVIIQLTYPLALVIILISFLSNENNAVTWSVITRTIQSTLWPSILGADSASVKGVRKRVTAIGALSTFGLVLLALAGILTPLGLEDGIAPGKSQSLEFEYVPDPTSFGLTSSREGYKFSRLCGYYLLMNCPGQFAGLHSFKNGTGLYAELPDEHNNGTMSTKIPNNITEIYNSGTREKGNTISNFFDIQYRFFYPSYRRPNETGLRQTIDYGVPHTKPAFRYLENLILKDQLSVVEGLVVATRSGNDGLTGVGFRNHTVPKGSKYGAIWEEDLLWMEPVTECVDMNLTLEYTVSDRLYPVNATLIDNGGMAELDIEANPLALLKNATQKSPLLRERAYAVAWLNNALTMIALNVTKHNRQLGNRYSLQVNFTTGQPDFDWRLQVKPDRVAVTAVGGFYLNLDNGFKNITNPQVITRKNFTILDDLLNSHRLAHRTIADADALMALGGILIGAGYRTDGLEPFITAPGTRWGQRLFSCMTGVRATVKTVTFMYNSTMQVSRLHRLKVNEVRDKAYASEDEFPLWAIEKTNMSLADASPLWAMITPEHANKKAYLQSFKARHLWMLGGPQVGLAGVDSVAGSNAYLSAISNVWDPPSQIPDLSGEMNYALLKKWRGLSRSVDTAGQIVNLIWTEIYAHIVVGTKSTISSQDPDFYLNFGIGNNSVPKQWLRARDERNSLTAMEGKACAYMDVRTYKRQITYKMVFGIPGVLMLLLWVIVLISALSLWLSGRASTKVLKSLLNQTSTGRVVTNLTNPDDCAPNAPTKEWIKKMGRRNMGFVPIRAAEPSASGVPQQPERKNGYGRLIPEDEDEQTIRDYYPHRESKELDPSINEKSLAYSDGGVYTSEDYAGALNPPPSSSSSTAPTLKADLTPPSSSSSANPILRVDTKAPTSTPSPKSIRRKPVGDASSAQPPQSSSSARSPFGSPFAPFSPSSAYSPLSTTSTSYDPGARLLASFNQPSTSNTPSEDNGFNSPWTIVHGEVVVSSPVDMDTESLRPKSSSGSLGRRFFKRSGTSPTTFSKGRSMGPKRSDTALSEVKLGFLSDDVGKTPVRSVLVENLKKECGGDGSGEGGSAGGGEKGRGSNDIEPPQRRHTGGS